MLTTSFLMLRKEGHGIYMGHSIFPPFLSSFRTEEGLLEKGFLRRAVSGLSCPDDPACSNLGLTHKVYLPCQLRSDVGNLCGTQLRLHPRSAGGSQ